MPELIGVIVAASTITSVFFKLSLLTLRFVHGSATAIFSPVASAYVAGLGETGRGARLGWFSSANDVGATAGPLAGGFVLYFTASYSVTYLLVGALGLLTLLVVMLLPDARTDRTAATSNGSRQITD